MPKVVRGRVVCRNALSFDYQIGDWCTITGDPIKQDPRYRQKPVPGTFHHAFFTKQYLVLFTMVPRDIASASPLQKPSFSRIPVTASSTPKRPCLFRRPRDKNRLGGHKDPRHKRQPLSKSTERCSNEEKTPRYHVIVLDTKSTAYTQANNPNKEQQWGVIRVGRASRQTF